MRKTVVTLADDLVRVLALLSVAWFGLLLEFALAQTPQPPTPESVVELSIAAMGGRKALNSIRSITALADCVGPNGPYKTEVYSARGGRLKFRQIRPGEKAFLSYINGNQYWTKDETSGLVSAADNRLAVMIRSHEFQMIAITPLERYGNAVFDGYEDFDGVRCLKLRVTDELGKIAYLFFREDQRLMAGVSVLDPRFETPTQVRIVFKDWMQVGKAKLPSKVIATDKSGDFTLDFKKIILNRTDERIFEVPPKVAAVTELMQLHEQARVAHLSKNAGLLVSTFAEGFINIADGKITKPTKEESLRRFQTYLDRSVFLEWDDLSPPIVRVSEDATMAYVIVHKRVRLKAASEKDDSPIETTVFGWMETYEKRDGKWALTAIASTKEPVLNENKENR